MKKIIVLASLFILAVIVVACGGNDDGNGNVDNNNGASVNANAEALFKNNCASCHGGNLEGGIGPNLQTIGKDMSKEDILNMINNGSDDGKMPAELLEGDDADEVAAWLASKK